MRGFLSACSFGLLTLIASTAAGEVRYIRNGDATHTVLPGTNEVPVVASTNFVHVYSSAPTSESIPAITITGTSSQTIIKVLVAGSSASFPTSQFDDSIPRGCINFGGLSFADTGTRDKSRLVVSAPVDYTFFV